MPKKIKLIKNDIEYAFYREASHNHNNKEVIDKLSVNDNNLLFDGKNIISNENIINVTQDEYDNLVKNNEIDSTKTYMVYTDNEASEIIEGHTHNNKKLLDSLTNNGDGTKYLADNGNYKEIKNNIVEISQSEYQTLVDNGQVDNNIMYLAYGENTVQSQEGYKEETIFDGWINTVGTFDLLKSVNEFDYIEVYGCAVNRPESGGQHSNVIKIKVSDIEPFNKNLGKGGSTFGVARFNTTENNWRVIFTLNGNKLITQLTYCGTIWGEAGIYRVIGIKH